MFPSIYLNKCLDRKLDKNSDLGQITLRNAFKKILITVLIEQDEYDSKRPFGNSDFYSQINKVISKVFPDIFEFEYDEYDTLVAIKDFVKYNKLIKALVKEL